MSGLPGFGSALFNYTHTTSGAQGVKNLIEEIWLLDPKVCEQDSARRVNR